MLAKIDKLRVYFVLFFRQHRNISIILKTDVVLFSLEAVGKPSTFLNVTDATRGAAKWGGLVNDYLSYSRVSGYYQDRSTVNISDRFRNEVPYVLKKIGNTWHWIVVYTANDMAWTICEKALSPEEKRGNVAIIYNFHAHA